MKRKNQNMSDTERLHKYLARCGVASRRKCEILISEGRVSVNGRVVTEPGTVVNPDQDSVSCDGHKVVPQDLVVLAMHKPVDVLSAVEDKTDRTTVLDLLPDLGVRLYPVGRLDYASEGLLLLSNDGNLTQRVLHPSYRVEREYEAKCKGELSEEKLELLRRGVKLEDGMTHPARVSILRRPGMQSNFWLRFVVTEGRNRLIRRMCEAVDLAVLRLRRVRIGHVLLGDLKPGRFRFLNVLERNSLLNPAKPQKKRAPKAKPKGWAKKRQP